MWIYFFTPANLKFPFNLEILALQVWEIFFYFVDEVPLLSVFTVPKGYSCLQVRLLGLVSKLFSLFFPVFCLFFLSFSFFLSPWDEPNWFKRQSPRTLQEKQELNTNSSCTYGITYFIIRKCSLHTESGQSDSFTIWSLSQYKEFYAAFLAWKDMP